MKRKANIICTGMLDTKEEEIKYLATEVKALGANPIIVDISLGHEANWADIPLREVLKEVDKKPEDVFKLLRGDASAVVGNAGAKLISRMYKEGKVDGIIAWSGGVGTTTVTYLMRALPIGVPKMMLSMLATKDTSQLVGMTDMFMSCPISEKGINKITKKTVGNGVAGVVAMANRNIENEDIIDNTPMAAITMYGSTTPAVLRCAKFLDKLEYETLFIPQGGLGSVMEDLIRDHQIQAIFDITVGEITNTYFKAPGRMPDTWPHERYTAAFEMGIPTVTAPGGLDQCAFGPWERMSDELKEDFKTGKRNTYKDTGKPFFHTPLNVILPVTLEETEMFANYMIERINRAKGPVALLVPMRGWSAYDQEEAHASKEMGWADEGDGPNWIPDDNNPQWSKRATTAWNVFQEKINRSNKNIDIYQLDCHILDEAFSDFACKIMNAMLKNEWQPGMYQDEDFVF